MKNADLISPAARLADAMKKLEKAWMETREHWSDPVSQKVEDEYLVPLHGEVRTMLDTIEKLSGVLSSAERACMHPREHGQML